MSLVRSKTVMGRSGAARLASIAAASPAATPPTMTSPSFSKSAAERFSLMGKHVQLNRDQRRRQKAAAPALEERAPDVVPEEAEEDERDERDGEGQDDEVGVPLGRTLPAELQAARDEHD